MGEETSLSDDPPRKRAKTLQPEDDVDAFRNVRWTEEEAPIEAEGDGTGSQCVSRQVFAVDYC